MQAKGASSPGQLGEGVANNSHSEAVLCEQRKINITNYHFNEESNHGVESKEASQCVCVCVCVVGVRCVCAYICVSREPAYKTIALYHGYAHIPKSFMHEQSYSMHGVIFHFTMHQWKLINYWPSYMLMFCHIQWDSLPPMPMNIIFKIITTMIT